MAGTAASAYLATVQWDDEDLYLHDFAQKFSLPQVAKITRGQYFHLGVPNLANPSLSQTVLFTQSGKKIRVAAQCVKFKDGGRVVPVGNKLSIPDNFEGYFEILSEDGRAVRCIESVAELLKRFPETCLVRENMKCYLPKSEDGETVSEKTRMIPSGETLALVGEVKGSSSKSKYSGRYLRCFTSRGDSIFLNVDQKGKFSPIAGEDNISGVHTIKNLLSKRFPLMVRLISGKPPAGIKNGSHFVTEMRLYSLFEEESIIAMPLLKDAQVIAVPPSAQLKVQAPKNPESLIKTKMYDILVEKCVNVVKEASDKIQVFDISLSKELKIEKVQKNGGYKSLPPIHRVQRSVSDPNSKYKDGDAQFRGIEGKVHNVENYDEIDQIYDYVRGFAPPPVRHTYIVSHSNGHSPSSSPTTTDSAEDARDKKPEPPPVETIPVRRMSKGDSPPARRMSKEDSPPARRMSKEDSPPARRMSKEDSPPVAKSNQRFFNNNGRGSEVADLVEGHIYEKVASKKDPMKTNSGVPARASQNGEKMFIPHQINHGVKKILLKGPAQNRIQHKSSKFKHSKSSPALKEPAAPVAKEWQQRQRTSRSKSLTTSPLFNIRYKSLVNLAVDFDTLDSSNSGDKASYDSGGSNGRTKSKKSDRKQKLQRPKSLVDIFGDVNQVDNKAKNRNSITNGIENRKMIFCHDSVNGRLLNNGHNNKRIGTLYL